MYHLLRDSIVFHVFLFIMVIVVLYSLAEWGERRDRKIEEKRKIWEILRDR